MILFHKRNEVWLCTHFHSRHSSLGVTEDIIEWFIIKGDTEPSERTRCINHILIELGDPAARKRDSRPTIVTRRVPEGKTAPNSYPPSPRHRRRAELTAPSVFAGQMKEQRSVEGKEANARTVQEEVRSFFAAISHFLFAHKLLQMEAFCPSQLVGDPMGAPRKVAALLHQNTPLQASAFGVVPSRSRIPVVISWTKSSQQGRQKRSRIPRDGRRRYCLESSNSCATKLTVCLREFPNPCRFV